MRPGSKAGALRQVWWVGGETVRPHCKCMLAAWDRLGGPLLYLRLLAWVFGACLIFALGLLEHCNLNGFERRGEVLFWLSVFSHQATALG